MEQRRNKESTVQYFSYLDSGVVETTCEETRRICCTILYIVNGAVFHHVLVVFFFVGIACGINRERVGASECRQT
jgi:hypothetical protein